MSDEHLHYRQRPEYEETHNLIAPDVDNELTTTIGKKFRLKSVGFRSFIIIVLSLFIVPVTLTKLYKSAIGENNHRTLPPWIPGQLDIHHLRVGPSESTFIVFPDGTTLLIDSGDIDIPKQKREWKKAKYEFEIKDIYPNDSKSASGWIIDYMIHFWPRSTEDFYNHGLDYVLVTHFHTDHIGDPSPNSRLSKNGFFFLSGIPEIGEHVKIHTLLDRGFPNYDIPTGRIHDWESLENYKKFTESKNVNVEQFLVGSNDQIRMRRDSESVKQHFLVRNIKGNLDVVVPSNNDTVVSIQGKNLKNEKSWDENELSNAIVIEYGSFRYYEGGDQESHIDSSGNLFDTITPTAIAAGMVDVATLNHHGHGVNAAFAKIMDPKIAILQGWCSDQPPAESMKYLNEPRRNKDKRYVYATDMFKNRLRDLGNLAHLFVSTAGHVVVRVYPPENQHLQLYDVFVLDENRKISSSHGPYKVDKKAR